MSLKISSITSLSTTLTEVTKSAERGGDKTQTQNLHQKSAKIGAFAFWKLQENKERN